MSSRSERSICIDRQQTYYELPVRREAEAFRDEACEKAGVMLDCNTIVFDVRSFDAIDEITFPPVEFDDEGNPVNFVFEPGGPEKYSVVRASIHHKFITPFMDKLFRMGPDMPAIVARRDRGPPNG